MRKHSVSGLRKSSACRRTPSFIGSAKPTVRSSSSSSSSSASPSGARPASAPVLAPSASTMSATTTVATSSVCMLPPAGRRTG
ncbi:MAG TPA: hypothetical protein VF647_02150 [Longimicrobium sp.]